MTDRLGFIPEFKGEKSSDSTTDNNYIPAFTKEIAQGYKDNRPAPVPEDEGYSLSDLGGDVLASGQAGFRVLDETLEGGAELIGPNTANAYRSLKSDAQRGMQALTPLQPFSPQDTEGHRSALVKEGRANIDKAEGFTDTLGAAVANPAATLSHVGDSIVPMVATGVGAGVLKAAGMGAMAAAGTSEGALMAGSQAHNLAQDGELSTADKIAAGVTGVVGAATGFAGGKLADKFDAINPEAIFQGKISKVVDSVGLSTGKSVLIEGGEEIIQSSTETITANVAEGRPAFEGVGKSAALGLVTGGTMGGVMGFTFSKKGVIDPDTGSEFQNKKVSDSARKLDNLGKLKDSQEKRLKDQLKDGQNVEPIKEAIQGTKDKIEKTKENLVASKKKDKDSDGIETDAKTDYNDEVDSVLKHQDKKQRFEGIVESANTYLDLSNRFESEGFTEKESEVLASNVMEKFAYSENKDAFLVKFNTMVNEESILARKDKVSYFGDTVPEPESQAFTEEDTANFEAAKARSARREAEQAEKDADALATVPVDPSELSDLQEDPAVSTAISDAKDERSLEDEMGTITSEDEVMLAEDLMSNRLADELTEEELSDLSSRSDVQVDADLDSDIPEVADQALEQKNDKEETERNISLLESEQPGDSSLDVEVNEKVQRLKSQVAAVKQVKALRDYNKLPNYKKADFHIDGEYGLVKQLEDINASILKEGGASQDTVNIEILKSLRKNKVVKKHALAYAIEALEKDVRIAKGTLEKMSNPSSPQTQTSATIASVEEANVEVVAETEVSEEVTLQETPPQVREQSDLILAQLESMTLEQISQISSENLSDPEKAAKTQAGLIFEQEIAEGEAVSGETLGSAMDRAKARRDSKKKMRKPVDKMTMDELRHAVRIEDNRYNIEDLKAAGIKLRDAGKATDPRKTKKSLSEALSEHEGEVTNTESIINGLEDQITQVQQEEVSDLLAETKVKKLRAQIASLRQADPITNPLNSKTAPIEDDAWAESVQIDSGDINMISDTVDYSVVGPIGAAKIEGAIGAQQDAIRMMQDGVNPTQIWKMTNWFYEPKAKDWKFEINDSEVVVMQSSDGSGILRYDQLENNGKETLNRVIQHKTLFNIYPQLAYYTVIKDTKSTSRGVFDPMNKTITLNYGRMTPATQDTLIHEIQHFIQTVENFSRGGDPDAFTTEQIDSYITKNIASFTEKKDLLDVVKNILLGKDITTTPEAEALAQRTDLDTVIENIVSYDRRIRKYNNIFIDVKSTDSKISEKAYSKIAFTMYTNLLGEMEARDTAFRRLMSDQQRSQIMPMSSVPLPESQKIVKGSFNKISFSLAPHNPDIKQNTTKLLESLDFTTKAKNKNQYVQQKMNQLKVTKVEKEVVTSALEAIDPEAKGKFEWVELRDAVQMQIADVSAVQVENEYDTYGLEGILSEDEFVNTDFSDTFGISIVVEDAIEKAISSNSMTIRLELFEYMPDHKALIDEMEIASQHYEVISSPPNNGTYTFSIPAENELDLIESVEAVLHDLEGSANTLSKGIKPIFTEFRMTEPGRAIPLTFPYNPSGSSHGLSTEATAHSRSFIRDKMEHIVEIQSDLKQLGSGVLQDLQSEAAPLTLTEEELSKLKGDIEPGLKYVNSTLARGNFEKHPRLPISVVKSSSDLLLKKAEKYLSYHDKNLLEDIDHVSRSFEDGDTIYHEDFESVFRDIESIMNKTLSQLEGPGVPSRNEEAVAGFEAIMNPHWQRVKPSLEIRLVREAVANRAAALAEDPSNNTDKLRIATSETVAKVEGWSLEEPSHKGLFSKHAKLVKAITKEFNAKEVKDDNGVSWIEIPIPENYVPPAFSLNTSEDTGVASSKDKRRAFNHIKERLSISDLSLTKEDGEVLDFSIVLLESEADLPSDIQVEGQGVEGAFDRMTNTVYIVSDTHSSIKGLVTTLAHEVIGHVGIRKVLGKSVDNLYHRMLTSNQGLLNDIVANIPHYSIYMEQWLKTNSLETQDKDTIYETTDANGNRIKIPKAVAMRLADEYMANLAGKEVFYGSFIKDRVGKNKGARSAKAKKRSKLINSFIGKITHQLRRVFGMTSENLTHDDLLEIIAESTHHVFKRTAFDYSLLISEKDATSLDTAVQASILAQKAVADMEGDTQLTSDTIKVMLEGGYGKLNQRWHEKKADLIGRRIRNNRFLSKFFALGALDSAKELSVIQSRAAGSMVHMHDFSMKFGKISKGMNEKAMAELMVYFTTADAIVPTDQLLSDPKQDAEFKEMIPLAKKAIADLGENMVGLGLLDSETYLDNKDTYLQTRYIKYLVTYKGSKAKPSFQDYLKRKDPNLSDLDKARLGQIKDPGFLVAETIGLMSRDIALNQMYNAIYKTSKDNELKWILGSEDKVIDSQGSKVNIAELKKTIDHQQELVDMHNNAEISGALNYSSETYNIIKGELNDNLAVLEMYNARVRRDVTKMVKKFEGVDEPTQEEIDSFIHAEYKQIPASKRYGSMAGEMVRKEIFDSLIAVDSVFAEAHDMKLSGKLVTAHAFFKWAKVAANPTSYFRNGMSNGMMLDLGTNTNFATLTKMLFSTAQSLIDRHNGDFSNKYLEIAIKGGLKSTTMSSQELQHLQKALKNSIKSKEATNVAGQIMPALNSKFLDFVDFTSKSFGIQELLFKTVALQDHIQTWEKENGTKIDSLDIHHKEAVISEAIYHANKTLLDYSKVNKTIGALRRLPLGAPFLTFMYKSFPVMVENTAKRPWKMAGYMAMPYFAALMVQGDEGWDDDDFEEFQAKLPLYTRNTSSLFVLPFKIDGKLQMVNMEYIFPAAPYMSAALKMKNEGSYSSFSDALWSTMKSTGSVTSDTYGFLGGPIPSMIVALQANERVFGNKPVWTEGAPAWQKTAEISQYTAEMMLPPWATSQGIFNKLLKSYNGYKTYDLRGTQQTVGQAALSFTGISLSNADPEAGQSYNAFTFTKEVKAHRKALRKAMIESARRSDSPEKKANILRGFKESRSLLDKKIKSYKESIGK